MTARAKEVDLVLHVGLHKTASTYVQNVFSARRYDLVRYGILYPTAGTVDDGRVRSREGAQSGHIRFTRKGRRDLIADLLHEVPPDASTILLSSEDFTLPRVTPAEHLDELAVFRSVRVVAVVRRQDAWIESFYKQAVDQYGRFETRPFGRFLAEEGPALLDFHRRLTPWRDLVGPDRFHALSYDDAAGGADLARRILAVAGVPEAELDDFPGTEVPRFESVRAIDTLGLRILNSYRLTDRDARNRIARAVYDAAPEGDLELMTAEMRAGIAAACADGNERIEAEWFAAPVPGFRFGAPPVERVNTPPTAPDLVEYVDRVLALCEAGRAAAPPDDVR